MPTSPAFDALYGGEALARPFAEHRAGEDQPSALAHHAGGGPGAEERAGEVDVDHLAPDLRLDRERAGDDRGDAGVADPHVDAAPLGDGGVGDRFVEVGVADVAAEHERRSPGSSSATAFRSRSVRATSATFAPACENAWARTSPSPRPAPVITTRRPLTSPGWGNVSGISIRSAIGTFPSTFASIGPISTIHAVRAMIAVDGRTDPRRDQPHARHPEGHAALPRGRRRPAPAAVARLGSRRQWVGELPGEPAGIRRALPHARARHAGLRQELLVRGQPGDGRAAARSSTSSTVWGSVRSRSSATRWAATSPPASRPTTPTG